MPDIERHALTEHWRKANAHHHRANRKGLEYLEEANKAGSHLAVLKTPCDHGRWMATVKKHFEGSYDTANDYMNVHLNWHLMQPYLERARNLTEPLSLRGFKRYVKYLETSNKHPQPVDEELPDDEALDFGEDDPYEPGPPGEHSPQGRAPDQEPVISGTRNRRPSRPKDASEPSFSEPTEAPRASEFDIELDFVNHTIAYLEVLLTDISEGERERLKKAIVGLTRATDMLKRYSPTQVDVLLPTWIDPERWDQFVVLRGAKGKPVTGRGARLMLDRLHGFRSKGHDPNEMLDQTIREGWQGVFPIRDNENGEEHGTDTKANADRYKKYEGLIQ